LDRLLGGLLITGLLLAGCSVTAPRIHYYRLAVAKPQADASTPRFDGVLTVKRFTADGLIDDRPLLQSGNNGLEVRPSHYHYWTEPPTEMVQEQLASYLEAAQVATTVVTSAARVRRQYVVHGRINRFERVLGSGENRVSIELRLSLADDAGGTILWNHTYNANVQPTDGTVPAAISAFRRGLGDIFAQFTTDITTRTDHASR
jgi:ABC-type uncharacterized transport system auxiliary subunit